MSFSGEFWTSAGGRMNLFWYAATRVIAYSPMSGTLPAWCILSQYWWNGAVHRSCPMRPKACM